MNKLTIIYGESGTGKSRIVKKIMEILSDHIPQIQVYSPTDRQNQTYSADDMVQSPFIHYVITEESLRLICERQASHRKKYDEANNIDIMYRLFVRYATPELKQMVEVIKRRLIDALDRLNENAEIDLETRKSEQMDAQEKTTNLLREVYRKEIIANLDKFKDVRLSEDEKLTIALIRFQPRILIIFDDVTEHLKALNKSEYLQQIFYAGRHNFITTIIACHTDKAFTPELKKQAFVNIFTSPRCASSYFERSTNNFSRQDKQHANNCIRTAFNPAAKFQKLIWIRLDDEYFRWTARRTRDIKFCSPAVRAFASAIAAAPNSRTATSNRFDASFL